jgi:hypothetical protein
MQGFSSGRRHKAKIVRTAIDDEDNEEQNTASATDSMEVDPPSVPSIKRLSKPVKASGSKLKLSFGADDVRYFTGILLTRKDAEEEQSFVQKRSTLSKKVAESKGVRKFGLQTYDDSLYAELIVGVHCKICNRNQRRYLLVLHIPRSISLNSEIQLHQHQGI